MSKNSQNSNHKATLKPNEKIPEDIHYEWLELIRSIQAACHGNQGLAKLTIQVSIDRNRPILWGGYSTERIRRDQVTLPKVRVEKLHPKRVADFEMSSSLVAALLMFMD